MLFNKPIILILKLTSGNKIVFHNYQYKIQTLLNHYHFNVIKQTLPIKYKQISLLRSPHVYKKSIETFETRIYSSQYKFLISTYSTYFQIFYLIKFLTKNIPSSITLTIKLSNNVKTNL